MFVVAQNIIGNRIEIGNGLNACNQKVIRDELTFVTKVPCGNFFLQQSALCISYPSWTKEMLKWYLLLIAEFVIISKGEKN